MEKNNISRRDFLKVLSLIPGTIAVHPLATIIPSAGISQPHMIVIVYDAWTAHNTSLYGYSRATMPNLEKFSQKAIVYHNHYSPAIFTVPGTASLLTGLYPWNHRAFSLGGRISHEHQYNQIFNLLSPTYQTVGYAQNKYAGLFLYQAGEALKKHIPNYLFNLDRRLLYSLPLFNKDPYIAFSSLEDNIFQAETGFDGSLILGSIYRTFTRRTRFQTRNNNYGLYSEGLLPDSTEQFLLSDVIDGAIKILSDLREPSLVYLHFFPPHAPYRPTKKFNGHFSAGLETLVRKPVHSLSVSKVNYAQSTIKNQEYDEYLASWDAETARLYQYIEESGLKNNSYIFLTSDHGEFFERGEQGHSTVLLNQPVVHIPLIVSMPGSTRQQNIHENTSAVDILPTLAHINGLPRPTWAEGEILPGLGGNERTDRAVFCLEARKSAANSPLINFSAAITKNNKRLLFYKYEKKIQLELFDLDQDPEEMKNLHPKHPDFGKLMEDELMGKISEFASPLEK